MAKTSRAVYSWGMLALQGELSTLAPHTCRLMASIQKVAPITPKTACKWSHRWGSGFEVWSLEPTGLTLKGSGLSFLGFHSQRMLSRLRALAEWLAARSRVA